MSELIAYKADVTIPVYGTIADAQVYLKSEADKVIAELKSDITDLRDDKKLTDAILGERNSEISELKAQKAQAEDDCAYWKMREGNSVNAMHETEEACMLLTKSERHHKYKRCLAMAKWCAKTVDHLNSEGYIYEHEDKVNERDDCIKGTEFYHKWYERWLKIAEQFKGGK